MKQKDIVWVRLPFSDLERKKARPALVVSRDAYNHAHDDVVVCAITSNLQPGEYKVGLAERDLDSGNLPIPSMVRVDKVLQIEKKLIDRTFARVKNGTYDEVVKRLHSLVRRQKTPTR